MEPDVDELRGVRGVDHARHVRGRVRDERQEHPAAGLLLYVQHKRLDAVGVLTAEALIHVLLHAPQHVGVLLVAEVHPGPAHRAHDVPQHDRPLARLTDHRVQQHDRAVPRVLGEQVHPEHPGDELALPHDDAVVRGRLAQDLEHDERDGARGRVVRVAQAVDVLVQRPAELLGGQVGAPHVHQLLAGVPGLGVPGGVGLGRVRAVEQQAHGAAAAPLEAPARHGGEGGGVGAHPGDDAAQEAADAPHRARALVGLPVLAPALPAAVGDTRRGRAGRRRLPRGSSWTCRGALLSLHRRRAAASSGIVSTAAANSASASSSPSSATTPTTPCQPGGLLLGAAGGVVRPSPHPGGSVAPADGDGGGLPGPGPGPGPGGRVAAARSDASQPAGSSAPSWSPASCWPSTASPHPWVQPLLADPAQRGRHMVLGPAGAGAGAEAGWSFACAGPGLGERLGGGSPSSESSTSSMVVDEGLGRYGVCAAAAEVVVEAVTAAAAGDVGDGEAEAGAGAAEVTVDPACTRSTT
ncbi:Protein piccolo [Frankliniella fusca]|uniref:Protein piccolo n=1 Tax=Frankliniella fusca TaxID=407009 RepID=A0AAE1LIW8_9NEOP|nr:Protein piccolo [Frankliniella fusca]